MAQWWESAPLATDAEPKSAKWWDAAPLANPPSTLGDAARFAGTAFVRGLGGLVDFAADPLAPIRRMIDPRLEAMEQSARPRLGEKAGTAAFQASGIPEYQPTTPQGRMGLALATGAVGGAPFGGGGALTGALSSLAGQGTMEATDSERAATAAALATGLAAGGVSSGLNAIKGKYNLRVAPLVDEGVRPTVGQILGGRAGRYEEAATSVPLVGDMIRGARGRALEQYNRGAINQALRPIGEKLDKGTPIGREAIDEMMTKRSAAYDALMPDLTAKTDPQFIAEMSRLDRAAELLPSGMKDQYRGILREQIINRMSPFGDMPGASFKEAESELGRLASDYRHSSVASERHLGGALQEAQSVLRDWLVRSNPEKAKELQAANSAYAKSLRVQVASTRSGAEPGEFTPAQLQSAVKQLDPTLRKGAFARGDALMQEYADVGRDVLGNRVPDSGTPFRSMVPFLLGGALMGEPTSLAALGKVSAFGVPAWAMYSPRGQAAIAQALAGSPRQGGLPPGVPSLLGADVAARRRWGALSP